MFKILRFVLPALAMLALTACGTFSFVDGDNSVTTGSIGKSQPISSGHVYIFRGVGGRLASLDLDHLASKVKASGISAEVHNFTDWYEPAERAIKRYRSETSPTPIILVGHSMGGDMSLAFAEHLRQAGVPVSLVITFDPTRRAGRVPANVDRYINIYGSMNFFGGGDVRPAADFHGHFATVDLKDYWNVLHVNMVKIRGLQDAVIAKIVQVTTLPVNLEGITVPIRYVMPRNEPIELWDSGLPVRAEEGDTLKTLATRYSVPVWIVAQINKIDPAAVLKANQRLVIPRHLEAPLPAAGPLTSYAPQLQ
jgi:pimeloyl-ACP methyl ester carboxylesterase